LRVVGTATAADGVLIASSAPASIRLGEDLTVGVSVLNDGSSIWGGIYYPTWYVQATNLSWAPAGAFLRNSYGLPYMYPGDITSGGLVLGTQDLPTAIGDYSFSLECWHRQSSYSSTMLLMSNCPVTVSFHVLPRPVLLAKGLVPGLVLTNLTENATNWIDRATNLSTGVWQTQTNFVAGPGLATNWVDPAPPAAGRGYYRVRSR